MAGFQLLTLIAGEATDWKGLANGFGMILTGIFACIAAFSSLKNGHTLRSQNGAPKPPSSQSSHKKDASTEDWFKAPNFDE
jgi:hypothetical protein